MNRKNFTWLLATALACCVLCPALGVSNPVTNEFPIAKGEHWWGGAAGFGIKMPFDEGSSVTIDVSGNTSRRRSRNF